MSTSPIPVSGQKTLYISDLDGTLLNNNAALSEYTLRTINRLADEKGLLFSIATARTQMSACKIIDGLRISVPVILMNGVVIFDMATRRYLQTDALEKAAAERIIGILRRHGVTGFMYVIRGGALTVYYENLETPSLRAFHDERVRLFQKAFTPIRDFHDALDDEPTVYFTLRDRPELLRPVYERLLADVPDVTTMFYPDNYSQEYWFLESFSAAASKFHAVQFLREQLCFDRVVGFGDNLNDLPLFRACDESYAVANAKDEAKAAATAVIGANTAHGVAQWLERRFE